MPKMMMTKKKKGKMMLTPKAPKKKGKMEIKSRPKAKNPKYTA